MRFIKKKFTKKDLKSGMVVSTLGGYLYIVNLERNILIRDKGWMDLDDYSEDLKISADYNDFSNVFFDITKVYTTIQQVEYNIRFIKFKEGENINKELLKLIWKRNEV